MLAPNQRHFVALLPSQDWSPTDSLIVDCEAVPRFGLRGPGSCEWLLSDGVRLPGEINRASIDANGIVALRIGSNEAVLSGCAEGGSSLSETRRRWAEAEGRNGYDGFRQDAWTHLMISGADACDFMAEVAEVDFRPESMPAGHIAQTRALHLDVVIVRTDRFGVLGYELFFDVASRAYFIDALTHLGGGYRLLTAGQTKAQPN